MRRRRPRSEQPQPPAGPEMAVCVTEFRTAAVGHLIRRWQQLPLDHPAVQAHPEFFRGLVRLDGEVKGNGS
jgi:hypothetical protein